MSDLPAELNKVIDETAAETLAPTEPAPTLDPHRLDGQIYTLCKSRIERGIKKQESWWLNGRVMRDFIKGEQWTADLAKLMSPEMGWVRKSLNKMKALQTGILSQVAFEEPRVVGLPTRRKPEFIGKANVAATLMNHSIKECEFNTHQKLIAKDIIHFGAGFAQFGTNPERGGIPAVVRRSPEDVIVDPDATSIYDAKWIARKFPANIHAARKEYNEPALASTTEQLKIEGKKPTELAPAPEDESVEIWEMWCRADAIDFFDAKETSSKNQAKDGITENTPAVIKYLTETGNRVFYFSLTHSKLLADRPWKFILDHDMLPIWPIYFDEDTADVLPPSPIADVMPLQRSLNTHYTFLTTQAYVGSRIKFSMDKGQAAEQKTQEAMKSPEVGTIVPIEGGILGLKKIEFGELSMASVQMFKETNAQFDAISGFTEMFGGMQGARSAAEAAIRENRAQTNTSTMRVGFETGLKRILRGMWQIAMYTMSADKVAKIVGREEMGYVNPQTGAIDEDDKLNTLPVNWNVKPTPEDIRIENWIELVPNSTRRANPAQQATDLRLLIQDTIGLIGLYTQQGYRINQVRMARKLNYIFSRLLQSLGMLDFKQIEILPEDLSIDDRLMPRGQSEAQLIAKVEADLKAKGEQQAQDTDMENVEGMTEFFAQLGQDPATIQTELAKLTPTMRAALVEAMQGQGG